MILSRKGYNMVMWAAVMSVVLGVMLLLQNRFSNALNARSLQTGQYLLWAVWKQAPDFTASSDYNNTRTRTTGFEARNIIEHENHAGEIKTYLNPNTNLTLTNRISATVIDTAVEGLEDEFLDTIPLLAD